jgi:hypothetical protein
MCMLRMTAAAVLICIAAVLPAHAECVSSMPILWSNENLERGPAAWTGNVLAVTAFERHDQSIWIAIYDEHGFPVVAPRRIVESPQRGPMALLWTGQELGLFYVTANALTLQRLSPAGVPIGAPVPIVPSRRVSLGDEIDVVWSPALDAYFIGRTTTVALLGAWVTIVEADGTVRRDQRLIVQAWPRASIRVAVTEDGIGGVFYRSTPDGGFVYLRVGPEEYTPWIAVVPDGEQLVVGTYADRFILFRSVPLEDGRSAIHWLELDTEGHLVRPDTFLLTGSGLDVAPTAVVIRDSEIALAYRDAFHGFNASASGYMLYRMHRNGALISDLPFAAMDLGKVTFTSIHPFFWTGSAYVQVVGRGQAQTLNTHLVRYCPLRAGIAAPRTVRRGETVTFTSTGGGGVAPHTYDWTFGDRRSARGQSVQTRYSETGTYRVTLTIRDAFGLIEQATFDITVFEPRRRAVSH